MSAPATPRPIKARPTIKSGRLCALPLTDWINYIASFGAIVLTRQRCRADADRAALVPAAFRGTGGGCLADEKAKSRFPAPALVPPRLRPSQGDKAARRLSISSAIISASTYSQGGAGGSQ
jgi:hypothetical protein